MSASGDARPIGIFDSGMGGLTVLRALIKALPQESFVYLGDTARLPYGTKSADTVTRYAVQAARALTKRGVKLVVVACNTASAAALPALEAALHPTPVVGVIEPGAEAAVRIANGNSIAIIATEATVRGEAYVRAIHARAPNVNVVQQACSLFVPLAEEGIIDGPITELTAERYLATLLAKADPHVLVLGCTHFPVLAPVIGSVLARHSRRVALIDSAETTAKAVAQLLATQGLAANSSPDPQYTFLATDGPERFASVGEIFLGRKPERVELVDLQ